MQNSRQFICFINVKKQNIYYGGQINLKKINLTKDFLKLIIGSFSFHFNSSFLYSVNVCSILFKERHLLSCVFIISAKDVMKTVSSIVNRRIQVGQNWENCISETHPWWNYGESVNWNHLTGSLVEFQLSYLCFFPFNF